MTKRILSLDLARGFTVLFMAPVHAMLLFGKAETRDSVPGYVFEFIAEGPGAVLFMLLMGVSFFLAGKKKPGVVIKRVLVLILLGYGMNALKFVLPGSLGILPINFLSDMGVSDGRDGLLDLFLIGDILQFAAIAYLLLYIFSGVFKNHIFQFSLAFLLCFVSPLFWDLDGSTAGSVYLLELLGGKPPNVFFPILPWLVYPLAGYVMGYFIKDGSAVSTFFIPGILCIAFGWLTRLYFFPCPGEDFYRPCPGDTIYHAGIAMAWLAVWDWISKGIKSNVFFRILQFLSRHITIVYFIQWLMICWALPFIGYQTLGLIITCLVCVLVEINVVGVVFIINEMRPHGHSHLKDREECRR